MGSNVPPMIPTRPPATGRAYRGPPGQAPSGSAPAGGRPPPGGGAPAAPTGPPVQPVATPPCVVARKDTRRHMVWSRPDQRSGTTSVTAALRNLGCVATRSGHTAGDEYRI